MPDPQTLARLKRTRSTDIRLKPDLKSLRTLSLLGSLMLAPGLIVYFFPMDRMIDEALRAFALVYGILLGCILLIVGIVKSLNKIRVDGSGVTGSTREHGVRFTWRQIREVQVSPDGGTLTFRTSNRVFRIPLSEMGQKESEWFLQTIRPLMDESSFSNPEAAKDSEFFF